MSKPISIAQTLKMRWLHILYPVVKNFSGKCIHFIARIFNQVIIVFKEKKKSDANATV